MKVVFALERWDQVKITKYTIMIKLCSDRNYAIFSFPANFRYTGSSGLVCVTKNMYQHLTNCLSSIFTYRVGRTGPSEIRNLIINAVNSNKPAADPIFAITSARLLSLTCRGVFSVSPRSAVQVTRKNELQL